MSLNVSARNSRAGNGCANFMGAWEFLVPSAGENLHAHKIPRFLGGGGIRVFFWGGECQFNFYVAGIFLNKCWACSQVGPGEGEGRPRNASKGKVGTHAMRCRDVSEPLGYMSEPLVEIDAGSEAFLRYAWCA